MMLLWSATGGARRRDRATWCRAPLAVARTHRNGLSHRILELQHRIHLGGGQGLEHVHGGRS